MIKMRFYKTTLRINAINANCYKGIKKDAEASF